MSGRDQPAGPSDRPAQAARAPRSALVLDAANRAIIEALQRDGRQPYGTIAQTVGLSEAAVRRRVQRLRETGVLQIVAVTDPLQLGFTRQAMIGLTVEGDVRVVADKLVALPEVDYVVMCAGSFDLLAEIVCEDDDRLLHVLNDSVRSIPGRAGHRDVPLSQAGQADLYMGHALNGGPMPNSDPDNSNLSEQARRHLWMHFSRMGSYATHPVPVVVRGEGAYVWDQYGKRYLDGLAGLFTSQIGHGRTELAEAGAKQASTLAYFPLWTYAHPRAIELAERLAGYAPGDLNRVFFTSGGSEAVESAWKLARQYFRMTGQPQRTKVISREIAYHGTSMGALSITGIPDLKTPFEPLVPGAIKVPNTNFYRAPLFADDEVAFGQWAADEIERAIIREGANTVAAVYLEPVQNAGGCFPPPPGYFERVRQICDRHGALLVSDEVICAFGRLGHWFGADRYGYQPDIITVAKGLTSGYAPLGAMIASDRLMEPFLREGASFLHGFTFAGHPVSCAVALANLDVIEGEKILDHVRATEGAFRSGLESLYDLPIVGDVRGAGFFYGIELVKDKETRLSFDDEESERLLRGYLSGALFEAGLICRADDRGDPVVQLSPPLICGQEEIDLMVSTLREVLTEAWYRV